MELQDLEIEIREAKEVFNFYKYDINKEMLIKLYEEKIATIHTKGSYIISMKSPKFRSNIESIMQRIREVENDLKFLKECKNNKNEDRPRDIENEIKQLEKTYRMIDDYSTTAKGKELKKLLNLAISDLKKITKNVQTKKYSQGNKNIRYGYNKCFNVINKRVQYLKTTDNHIKESINLQEELLIRDLEESECIFNKRKIKDLFQSYFINNQNL